VGRFAARAAVGKVEEEIALVGRLISWQGVVGFNLRSSQRDKHFLEIIINT
jgi:hypothetical protein